MEQRLITSLTAATTLSLDATFRAAAKASFVNDDRSRASIFNRGLHTAVNQKALIIAYVSLAVLFMPVFFHLPVAYSVGVSPFCIPRSGTCYKA